MDEQTQITDWNDAYANRDHIPDAQKYIDLWEIESATFREEQSANSELDLTYGSNPREQYDMFQPEGKPKGLFVFVHGGYWMAFDKNSWSHMARQALAKNWAVAIPSYSLCPDVLIGDITLQIGKAIEAAAAKISGPIVLAGHSAGGHLVSRMGCKNSPLDEGVAARIQRIISISGVHDLRPLLNLELNQTLKLTPQQADAESPALLLPRPDLVLDCVAGGDERPEFIRQNQLLANMWIGLGAKTREILVERTHHFSVIDELSNGEQGWLDLGS